MIIAASLLTAGILYAVSAVFPAADPDPAIPVGTPQTTAAADPTADPEQDQRLTDASSILFCANKKHPLPEGYTPDDLVYVDVTQKYGNATMRREAAEAMAAMFSAAAADGVTLMLGTGFRDEEFQRQLYTQYVSQRGQEYADTISSRPGYSEHQTGLCADIGGPDEETYLDQSFISTPAGTWLYENAYRYGYILRYPQGKEEITGFSYEPWHYRYVGTETSQAMHAIDPDLTFEEYFGIAGGDYAE